MMTLKDRIALLKGGYTRKEIEALIEAEKEAEATELEAEVKEVEPVEVEAKEVTNYNEVITNLLEEVKDLKNVIYKNNISKTEIETPNLQDEAEKVLASLINPFNNKEE